MSIIGNLEKMLYSGEDNAMLRFGLGNAYFQQHDYHSAITHLQQAVKHDPGYSAAWKLLGKSLIQCNENSKAKVALQNGLQAAEKKGDIQAVKEMNVFLNRLDKS